MTDYGVPLFSKHSGDQKFIGVASYTISVEFISRFLREITLGETGFPSLPREIKDSAKLILSRGM